MENKEKLEEAKKLILDERAKELTAAAEALEKICKDFDINLDVEVIVNPNGVSKRVLIMDNQKLI